MFHWTSSSVQGTSKPSERFSCKCERLWFQVWLLCVCWEKWIPVISWKLGGFVGISVPDSGCGSQVLISGSNAATYLIFFLFLYSYSRFECEVRVRSVPLQPCRRHGKKRKDIEMDLYAGKTDTQSRQSPVIDGRLSRASSIASDASHGLEVMDSQLQSSQVTKTLIGILRWILTWILTNAE